MRIFPMRILLSIPVVASILVTASPARSDPPRNRAGSAAQRALENRQRGLNLPVNRPNGTVPEQAGPPRSIPTPHAGTGRLPREVELRRPGRFDDRERLDGRAIGRARGAAADRPDVPRAIPAHPGATADSAAMNGRERAATVSHGGNRLALTEADRLLALRLAQIDRLRDRALDNGNERLLEQADQLEQLARWQHAGRIEGRLGRDVYEIPAAEEGGEPTLIRHPFRRASFEETKPPVPESGPVDEVR
ncbi:MAG: hypothetical protein WD066_08235 [Planctomycetaceae bacterium]